MQVHVCLKMGLQGLNMKPHNKRLHLSAEWPSNDDLCKSDDLGSRSIFYFLYKGIVCCEDQEPMWGTWHDSAAEDSMQDPSTGE